MRHGTPGTLSHGTMLPDHLIPCFADELERLCDHTCGQREAHRTLIADAELMSVSGYDGEHADDTLTDLFDALDDHAPKGHTFGAHEGNGSDYGFWPVDTEEA